MVREWAFLGLRANISNPLQPASVRHHAQFRFSMAVDAEDLLVPERDTELRIGNAQGGSPMLEEKGQA